MKSKCLLVDITTVIDEPMEFVRKVKMCKTEYGRRVGNQEVEMMLDISQLILDRVRESEDSNNLSPVFKCWEEAKAWLDA